MTKGVVAGIEFGSGECLETSCNAFLHLWVQISSFSGKEEIQTREWVAVRGQNNPRIMVSTSKRTQVIFCANFKASTLPTWITQTSDMYLVSLDTDLNLFTH